MAKRKRKKDPLAGPRYNGFGTEKQSKQNALVRDLKNRIHQLESDNEALMKALDNYKGREVEYLRRIAVRTPGSLVTEAVAAICALPFEAIHGLMNDSRNIVLHVSALANWLDALEDKPVENLSYARTVELASVKAERVN